LDLVVESLFCLCLCNLSWMPAITVSYRMQFDRERIPERVVHARGASAKGFFEVPFCTIFRQPAFLTRGLSPYYTLDL